MHIDYFMILEFKPLLKYSIRSGPAHEIRDWNKNWDFREPKYETLPKTPSKYHVPSFAEHVGETSEQKAAPGKPTASRHLLFIRHGQYVNAEEDEKKVLTDCGRFVLFNFIINCKIWQDH